jgi:hypothetical protein
MDCKNCGTQLPDGANFCYKCGKPQSDNLQVDEPKWEICEIYHSVEKKGTIFSRPELIFWAKASGPNGNYNAGKSVRFLGDRVYDRPLHGIDVTPSRWDDEMAYAKNALYNLETNLLKDGWEFLGSFGEFYWKKRYRRRVR